MMRERCGRLPSVLLYTAGELLHAAAQKEASQLGEKLYLEICGVAVVLARTALQALFAGVDAPR